MLKKIIETYKIYFLISFVTFALLSFIYFEQGYLSIIFVFLGSLLTPFLYEADVLLYVYVLDPSSEYSVNIQKLILQKNYSGAFAYAHEHIINLTTSIFRSMVLVLLVFAVAFLIFLGYSNPFSKAVLLSYLLTSLYLQTISFTDNSWRSWYSFIEFVPKLQYARLLLIIEYLVFLFLLYKIV